MFEISYHPKIYDDLARIGKTELSRIRKAIEQKLTVRPHLYGTRLRGELGEYWKLRVGDYRIVYKIETKRVFVLMIKHRREVYRMAAERD